MKKYFKLFLYVSIVFLVVALARADYLFIPHIYSLSALVYSLFFLTASFFLFAYRWKKALQFSGYHVSYADGVVATGLSIFGKYIPGKVMFLAGLSLYIAEKHHYSKKEIGAIAFSNQLLILWTAILIGEIALVFIGGLHIWGWALFGLWLALTLTLFTRFFYHLAGFFLSKILRRKVTIPRLSFAGAMRIVPYIAIDLIARSIGFFFLLRALSDVAIGFELGFVFILAQSIGLMAIITPGGLGVREGVIVGLLTLSVFPVETATTISLAARLWYLAGELVIFLAALLVRKLAKP